MSKQSEFDLLVEVQESIDGNNLITQIPYKSKFEPIIGKSFRWKTDGNFVGPKEYNVVIIRISQDANKIDVFIDYLNNYLKSLK